MASPIGSLPTESISTVRPAQYDNTALRDAAQRVREARDYQQQKIEDAREAKTQADEASRRLQTTKIEEQQAAQRVRAAKTDEQQAIRTSQQRLRGNTIDVIA